MLSGYSEKMPALKGTSCFGSGRKTRMYDTGIGYTETLDHDYIPEGGGGSNMVKSTNSRLRLMRAIRKVSYALAIKKRNSKNRVDEMYL